MSQEPPGANRWMHYALRNRPNRNAHGLLGFWMPARASMVDEVEDFASQLSSGNTLLEAWIYACATAGDEPYAMVYRQEHERDKFCRPITAAGTAPGYAMGPDVTTDNFYYQYRDVPSEVYPFGPTVGADNTRASSVSTEEIGVVWRGRQASIRAPVTNAKRHFLRVMAVPHRFDAEGVRDTFRSVESGMSGAVLATREIDFGAESLALEDAKSQAGTFMKEHGFPDDASLASWSAMYRQAIDEEPHIIGYILTFGQAADGMPVVGDRVTLIVQSDGIRSVCADWHELTVGQPGARQLPAFNRSALQACLDRLDPCRHPGPTPPRVLSVRPVYYVGDMLKERPYWCPRSLAGLLRGRRQGALGSNCQQGG